MKIAVVGAGAGGLIAAVTAAKNGAQVEIFERNEKIGKKLFITGKGRCNLTNACDERVFLENVATNPKFLTSAVYGFPPSAVMSFFEENGLKLKVERGRRVFPASDKSSDVIKIFSKLIETYNIILHYNSFVKQIKKDDGFAVVSDENRRFDKVIVATGGKSYKATGSDGFGYSLAAGFGHTIKTPKPALSGIKLSGDGFPAGLTLKNVKLTVSDFKGEIFSDFGELLFTHDGISGPTALSASSYINKYDVKTLTAAIDLKPALTRETLEARLLREFEAAQNKNIANVLGSLLPKSLIPIVIGKSRLNGNEKINAVTKETRAALADTLKSLKFEIQALGDLDAAIVTSGGVSVGEINPKTMESKLCPNLYFAGEIIDADALTGGYNLQIAFCTGYAAGEAASRS